MFNPGDLVQIKTREEVLEEGRPCSRGSAIHKYGGSICKVVRVVSGDMVCQLESVEIVDNLPDISLSTIENWSWGNHNLKLAYNPQINTDEIMSLLEA